jgi:predicted NUDIX family NTP pyrophosphohydrolase
MADVRAGLLLFRRKPNFQVLLGHPGAPHWQDKDEGAWSIPKGISEDNETMLEAAKRGLEEEIGFIPNGVVEGNETLQETAIRIFGEQVGFIPEGNYIELGSVQQNDGKTIHAWGIACQIPDDFMFTPDFFEMEWPPDSGQMQEFPEIDRIEYFPPFEANRKINPAQRPFISRLITECSS